MSACSQRRGRDKQCSGLRVFVSTIPILTVRSLKLPIVHLNSATRSKKKKKKTLMTHPYSDSMS